MHYLNRIRFGVFSCLKSLLFSLYAFLYGAFAVNYGDKFLYQLNGGADGGEEGGVGGGEHGGTPGEPECEKEELLLAGSGLWWTYLCSALFCICFSGMMSGLTVGLLSIDDLELDIMIHKKDGNDEDARNKRRAEKIKPVLERNHHLLVTLLLCNALALEMLPIFLDKIVPSWLAVLLSVTAVLFFGEVIPQSLCIGPNQMAIASATVPLVKFLMAFTSPISWPLSKLLDRLLGEHKLTRFSAPELKAIIELHSSEMIAQIKKEGLLDDDDVKTFNPLQEKMIEAGLRWDN